MGNGVSNEFKETMRVELHLSDIIIKLGPTSTITIPPSPTGQKQKLHVKIALTAKARSISKSKCLPVIILYWIDSLTEGEKYRQSATSFFMENLAHDMSKYGLKYRDAKQSVYEMYG